MITRKLRKSSINLSPINHRYLKISQNSNAMGCGSSHATKTSAKSDNDSEITEMDKDKELLDRNDSKKLKNSPSLKTNGKDNNNIITSKYPPAEAFEIPLDESVMNDINDGSNHNITIDGEKTESIIKKHPPKRLQRLIEVPPTPATIEDLEEKLAKAEIRRQQYLQQRVEGATMMLAKMQETGNNFANLNKSNISNSSIDDNIKQKEKENDDNAAINNSKSDNLKNTTEEKINVAAVKEENKDSTELMVERNNLQNR